MKHPTLKTTLVIFSSLFILAVFQRCQSAGAANSGTADNIDSLKKIALDLAAYNETLTKNLKTFDDLDFDVFSNQKWDRLKESHA